MDMNLQPLVLAGTHRPDCPFTLQTSCFKLVLATQQAPSGTGRLALTPWGVGDARTELARARMRAVMVNFILGEEKGCWRMLEFGYLGFVMKKVSFEYAQERTGPAVKNGRIGK